MPETKAMARQDRNDLTWANVVDMTGFSMSEVAMIRHNMATSLRQAVDAVPLLDVAAFAKVCRSLGLDPLVKQAYWISRGGKPGLQIGIDGYRAVADRAGNYAGSSEPTFRGTIEWAYKNKTLVVPDYAQVLVWKIVQGHKCSFVGEARWREYVPKMDGAGDESSMWAKMPHNQLAKCAEAQALRKGWALQLGRVDFTTEDFSPGLSVDEVHPDQAQLAAAHARIFDANYPDDQTQASYVEHEATTDARDKQQKKADEAIAAEAPF